MITTITSTEMGAIIRDALDTNDMKPMLFLGKTGIGKSETVATIAKERGLGYIDIRILNHTETDFKGLPYPDAERKFTTFLQNKMLPQVERDGERGILVLDEITSGYKSVRTAIYQLLQERSIGDYRLPDNWLIICLGNGEKDGGDFNGMESAFGARCRCYRVESTAEDYLTFGARTGLNDLVLAYIDFQPDYLHTYDPEKDGTEECLGFACNRAWSSVSDILNRKGVNMSQGSLSNIDKLKIRGSVGETVGISFITFVELKREIVSVSDILDGKNVPAPKKTEVKHMTKTGVAALMAETVVAGGYIPGRKETMTTEMMTKVANGMLWLINNTGVEMAMSAITQFISKDEKCARFFISVEYDKFCGSSDKYSAINEFLEKHESLMSLDMD